MSPWLACRPRSSGSPAVPSRRARWIRCSRTSFDQARVANCRLRGGVLCGCLGRCAVDVQEIRKLDTYLKKLFGNARLRVVPRPSKADAEVYIGEERLGELNTDEDDEDLSYNFRMEIDVGEVSDADQ